MLFSVKTKNIVCSSSFAFPCQRSNIRNEFVKDEHKPVGVIENDHVKLLWDFNIQTATYIQARRPDVVVVDRDGKTCNVIDIAVPGDAGIFEKEKEKVEKYQDLLKRGGSCSYCGWCARRRHTQPF